MKTVKNREILLPEKEAEEKAAYLKADSIYSAGKLQFKVNELKGAAFRLVHNDTSVLALIEGTLKSQTTTIFKAEEFKTEQEVLTQIKKLGLKYETEAVSTGLQIMDVKL